MTSRSPDIFTTLLEPHLDKLYRLAYRFTGSVPDAEDLVQDVLVKLYERRDELTSIRDLSPWLSRVLYNQFIDDKRRYGRQPLKLVNAAVAPDEQAATGNGAAEPFTGTHNARLAGRLAAALARLSEEHRVVVLLHDAEGYKLTEIAELTGAPVGTLKSRLHRARRRLHELLAADGTFSEPSTCSSMDGVKRDAL